MRTNRCCSSQVRDRSRERTFISLASATVTPAARHGLGRRASAASGPCVDDRNLRSIQARASYQGGRLDLVVQSGRELPAGGGAHLSKKQRASRSVWRAG